MLADTLSPESPQGEGMQKPHEEVRKHGQVFFCGQKMRPSVIHTGKRNCLPSAWVVKPWLFYANGTHLFQETIMLFLLEKIDIP